MGRSPLNSFLWICFQVYLVFSTEVKDCSQYKFHEKPKEITPNHPYGLWPGMANKLDLENGEVLPGFYEVIILLFIFAFSPLSGC